MGILVCILAWHTSLAYYRVLVQAFRFLILVWYWTDRREELTDRRVSGVGAWGHTFLERIARSSLPSSTPATGKETGAGADDSDAGVSKPSVSLEGEDAFLGTRRRCFLC